MAITGPASYIPTMNEFIAHWAQCNTALAPQALVVRQPNNSPKTQVQFATLRDTLQAQQNAVQVCLTAQQIARENINLKKAALLAQLTLFTGMLDAYYRNTEFYGSRPFAPSITDGQDVFTTPLGDMMALWVQINAGVAPAGVTLPLVLPNGTSEGVFASAVSQLQFAYANERTKAVALSVARSKRDMIQEEAYEVMKMYRDTVPPKLVNHPELVDSLPRLSPLPGHTPVAVNASAVFQAPNSSRVAYDASTDAMLQSYQLRGNVGDHYSDADAVIIATQGPNAPREFVTPFGLTQPGTEVALKVFVILTTGNEAGSAALLVERPATVQLLAA